MSLATATFRPRVQIDEGSLARLGVIGNGVVLAMLPLFLIFFFLLAPLTLAAAPLFRRARPKPSAPPGRGALASR